VRLNKYGLTVLEKGLQGPGYPCKFEDAYFSHPTSLQPPIDDDGGPWSSFATFREACGRYLASESPVKNASFVVGVPDSGIALATGYANESHLPYLPLLTRDHFDRNGRKRLFMSDAEMAQIRSKVLGKILITPDRLAWRDAVVVVGDDSMVRGNVSPEITQAIKSLGAKEVHWVLGFPPVSYRCHLGVSMREDEELIASRHGANTELIAQAIGANSVRYISPEGFLRARYPNTNIVTPEKPSEIFLENHGCGGCITGVYPISQNGEIYRREPSG
jgi:amidophosphoribosyltransferase